MRDADPMGGSGRLFRGTDSGRPEGGGVFGKSQFSIYRPHPAGMAAKPHPERRGSGGVLPAVPAKGDSLSGGGTEARVFFLYLLQLGESGVKPDGGRTSESFVIFPDMEVREMDAVARSVDMVWVTLSAILVIFMQAGFALLEAGSTRMKNAGHIAGKQVLSFALAGIAFWRSE